MYSEAERGKPEIDPVFLFKIVLIQHLYGIRSMRQTVKEIEVNYAANTISYWALYWEQAIFMILR